MQFEPLGLGYLLDVSGTAEALGPPFLEQQGHQL
jgi:hypothetical protein